VREAVRTPPNSQRTALRAFGAKLTRTLDSVYDRWATDTSRIEAAVPGDISSAWLLPSARRRCFPGSSLVLDALGLNPTRAALLDVLTALAARISVLNLEERNSELVAQWQVQKAPDEGLGTTEISGPLAAQLIDELPVLAAIGLNTSGGIRIRDAKELRVKESDRIALVAQLLRAMGAEVTEF